LTDPKTQTETEQAESGSEPTLAGVEGNSAEAAQDPVAELEAALVAAEQKALAFQDAMLRMQAEMENLRKRMARDLERSRRLALVQLMIDLVPVRDSLERGLEAADLAGTVEALREGKLMTMKMLCKVMADHGLEEIDPRGAAFNPEFHEAISMLPSDEAPADTVLEVVQKGYRLHERLIRPARVVVSRGPERD